MYVWYHNTYHRGLNGIFIIIECDGSWLESSEQYQWAWWLKMGTRCRELHLDLQAKYRQYSVCLSLSISTCSNHCSRIANTFVCMLHSLIFNDQACWYCNLCSGQPSSHSLLNMLVKPHIMVSMHPVTYIVGTSRSASSWYFHKAQFVHCFSLIINHENCSHFLLYLH